MITRAPETVSVADGKHLAWSDVPHTQPFAVGKSDLNLCLGVHDAIDPRRQH